MSQDEALCTACNHPAAAHCDNCNGCHGGGESLGSILADLLAGIKECPCAPPWVFIESKPMDKSLWPQPMRELDEMFPNTRLYRIRSDAKGEAAQWIGALVEVAGVCESFDLWVKVVAPPGYEAAIQRAIDKVGLSGIDPTEIIGRALAIGGGQGPSLILNPAFLEAQEGWNKVKP